MRPSLGHRQTTDNSVFEKSFARRGPSAHVQPGYRRRDSPLKSTSPPPDRIYETSFLGPDPRLDASYRRIAAHSNERASPYRRGYVSPVKPEPMPPVSDYIRREQINPHATAVRVEDLLHEIEGLKADRDFYMKEADIERAKNRELEEEFLVLRSLIYENTRPIGAEENMALRSQIAHEREMRV